MTERIAHKAGDSFSLLCTAWLDLDQTTPRDLTNVTITATMSAPLRADISLTVVKSDPANGEFVLSAPDEITADWRPTTWHAWVTYEEGGDKDSTEAFQIEVVSDYNASI